MLLKPVITTSFRAALTLTGPSPCKIRILGIFNGSSFGIPISGIPEILQTQQNLQIYFWIHLPQKCHRKKITSVTESISTVPGNHTYEEVMDYFRLSGYSIASDARCYVSSFCVHSTYIILCRFIP